MEDAKDQSVPDNAIIAGKETAFKEGTMDNDVKLPAINPTKDRDTVATTAKEKNSLPAEGNDLAGLIPAKKSP